MTCSPSRTPAALLALFAAVPAGADESHYHNYPVGDRALGMGGAYRAIADDSSGAYYNPAGLAEVPATSFSLSAALYGVSKERLTLDLGGTPVDAESSVSSFVTYPTTGAWIQAIREGGADGVGRMRAALSVVTPDSDVRRSALVAPGIALLGESVEDSTLWAGASFAWRVHRRVSVGATLYALIRSGLYSLNFAFADVDPATEGWQEAATRLDAALSHYALLGVVGALVRPAEKLSVGVVARTPSVRAAGTADATLVDPVAGVEPQDDKFTVKIPWQLSLGVAYGARRRWLVAADLTYHGGVARHEILSGIDVEKNSVLNANLGGEWYAARDWPLRAGFFTNRSAFSTSMIDGSLGDDFARSLFGDDVGMYGVTLASGYELDNAALSLGVSYAFGSKDSRLLDQDLRRERSYLFFELGTSFYF